jgi:hypothetical protein
LLLNYGFDSPLKDRLSAPILYRKRDLSHFSACHGVFQKKLGAFLIFVVHFSIKPGATPEIVVRLLFSWCKRECVVHLDFPASGMI